LCSREHEDEDADPVRKNSFHCLFCHGFEERGAESVGVLATGLLTNAQMLTHISEMACRLAHHVTIYTNGNTTLQSEMEPGIKSSKMSFDPRSITKFRLLLQHGSTDTQGEPSGVEVTFSDGTTKKENWIASHPSVEQGNPFAEQLGLELGPMMDIQVNPPFNETNVQGCFAVGDAATPMRSVMQATHMGGFAGTGMCFQLQHELHEKDEL
jgi:thioredoxin reductase